MGIESRDGREGSWFIEISLSAINGGKEGAREGEGRVKWVEKRPCFWLNVAGKKGNKQKLWAI